MDINGYGKSVIMKQLIITPKLCTNCHICELACSFKHSQQFTLAYSRVRTIFHPEGNLTVPEICLQCIDAACMQACPSGALYVDEEISAVRVNYKKCVGCLSCVAACPFGNMLHDTGSPGYVFKCDLCVGDPVCARFCPTGALVYVEAQKLTGKQEMVLEEEEEAAEAMAAG
jgi:Fe-S-cluster-containing hydrogenase component 2